MVLTIKWTLIKSGLIYRFDCKLNFSVHTDMYEKLAFIQIILFSFTC